MRLSWVSLVDFRSHKGLRFEPDPGVNVLVGANGSGKTSILEAIGYLVTLASFRRSPDAALVALGAEATVIRGEFSGQIRDTAVDVEIPAVGRRRVMVNGKSARSRGDIAEGVALVAFLPDDLDLVKRGPALRREFIDDAAVQMWPMAGTEQRDYERALRQRNALLRTDGRYSDVQALSALDELVAERAADVLSRRFAAVDALVEPVQSVYRELGGGSDEMTWRYEGAGLPGLAPGASRPETLERLRGALEQARRHDMERRTTTVGPHRDEIVISIGGRDVRTRASQGEQRSAALALRVAVYRALAERRNEAPILLLDDVFSELDPQRSGRLVGQLPAGQVFVTSARAEEVPMVGQRWAVSPGSVTPQ